MLSSREHVWVNDKVKDLDDGSGYKPEREREFAVHRVVCSIRIHSNEKLSLERRKLKQSPLHQRIQISSPVGIVASRFEHVTILGIFIVLLIFEPNR